MATAIFRLDRSNSLQTIWLVAGQIVTEINWLQLNEFIGLGERRLGCMHGPGVKITSSQNGLARLDWKKSQTRPGSTGARKRSTDQYFQILGKFVQKVHVYRTIQPEKVNRPGRVRGRHIHRALQIYVSVKFLIPHRYLGYKIWNSHGDNHSELAFKVWA